MTKKVADFSRPKGFNFFIILGLIFIFLCGFSFSDQTVWISVSVKEQKLYLVKGKKVVKTYPVSTSKYGVGNVEGSNQTPTGRHRIAKKIGGGAPLGTIFKDRKNTHKIIPPNRTLTPVPGDYVTTRILWLEGLEPGVNRGGRVDSMKRCIYIHGTPDEGLIGRPASHGCIRMKNKDVAELFDLVSADMPVEIQ